MTPDQMKTFCGGFQLRGWRQADGTLRGVMCYGKPIADWPEEICIFGNTYVAVKKVVKENGHECVDYC